MNTPNRNPFYQHTLAGPVHFVGRGLHSGRPVSMTLVPADTDTGYVLSLIHI